MTGRLKQAYEDLEEKNKVLDETSPQSQGLHEASRVVGTV
jgi:hypothetical protein